MEYKQRNNKRIAKNTLLLYFRMLFLMLISLYTSRVVLEALGVTDYGIYNVVGGFVSLFSVVSAALTSATSRFLNFEQGKSNIQRQNIVFSTAVIIQWGLAIIVALFAEIVGVWYVNNIMVLPPNRLVAANWCFQLSIFNFCMNIITVPYNASIIAHEKMKAFAYVSIFQGLSILIISFLVKISPFDKLIFYAIMLCLVQFGVRYTYQIYCRKKFVECTFKRQFDKILLKKMLSYSLWHLVGNGASVLKTHGVNMVLNLFFGPAVNAAKGISNQVDAAVQQFVGSFMMAINPQITKSYASGNIFYMLDLVNKGARFSFFLIFMLSLPIIINANYILKLWLGSVPEYSVIFVQLTLIAIIIGSLSKPLITASNATGNVRNYQLAVGGIQLLNLPISYGLLLLGLKAESVIVLAIILEFIALFVRIFMLPSSIKEFKPLFFIREVCLRSILIAMISTIIPLLLRILLPENFLIFSSNIIVCFSMTTLLIFYFGCNKRERTFLLSKISSFRSKVHIQ